MQNSMENYKSDERSSHLALKLLVKYFQNVDTDIMIKVWFQSQITIEKIETLLFFKIPTYSLSNRK